VVVIFIDASECDNFQQKLGQGLDEVHPFSDTIGVDVVLREAANMLSANFEAVGPKNAARIWGFMSKFVMLDRFSTTLGAAKIYPGLPVLKQKRSNDYLGSATKVGNSLYPLFANLIFRF
jgi:hypothetical protein